MRKNNLFFFYYLFAEFDFETNEIFRNVQTNSEAVHTYFFELKHTQLTLFISLRSNLCLP